MLTERQQYSFQSSTKSRMIILISLSLYYAAEIIRHTEKFIIKKYLIPELVYCYPTTEKTIIGPNEF